MTASILCSKILHGDFDDDLDMLIRACRNRKEIVVESLRAGDTIRLTGSIRPKYLVGAELTVIRTGGGKVYADFPDDARLRRFSGALSVGIPATSVEKVEGLTS